jgi:hypothetical protein
MTSYDSRGIRSDAQIMSLSRVNLIVDFNRFLCRDNMSNLTDFKPSNYQPDCISRLGFCFDK